MKRAVLRTAVSAFGLWLATLVVRGIRVDGAGSLAGVGWLAAAAVLLGMANAVVRPVLIVLTLPITILTLGLFLLVINAATFALAATLLPGFHVDGFVPAFFGSLLVGAVNWIGFRLI